jgi:hypothetical protein
MAKRKSTSDRTREAREVERDAFRAFREGVEQMNSFTEIMAAVASPDRFGPNIESFLSNIGYFLGHNFAVPQGATQKELALYGRLVQKLGNGLPDRSQILAQLEEARREPLRRL